MKKRVLWILGIFIFVAGIGTMAYPILSAQYTEQVRSRIYTEYRAETQQMGAAEVETALAAAREYNRKLFLQEISPLSPQENGYFSMLSLSGSGIMGYVHIPKIGVELPIYHGTGESVLKKGAGHMAESSLPVGGDSTHAVLSAHSGMAGDPMFSDLGLLEIGDLFRIEIAGENLTYEVDQIQIVLPTEIEDIQIQRGKDLVTLVTCTPYGINTHRLLVRGQRVTTPVQESVEEMEKKRVQTESLWQSLYWTIIQYAVFLLVGLLLLMLAIAGGWHLYQRRKERRDDKA